MPGPPDPAIGHCQRRGALRLPTHLTSRTLNSATLEIGSRIQMSERSKTWEWGQTAAIAVILWAIFGSPPPVLGKVLGLGGALFLLLYYVTRWWEQRGER